MRVNKPKAAEHCGQAANTQDLQSVLVLNQYALPRSEPGGTRHVELFSRTAGWASCIVAGNRNHYTQSRISASDPRMKLLPVPRSNGGAVQRVGGWVVYSFGVLALGGTIRRPDVIYASSPHLFTLGAGLLVARMRRVPLVVEVRDLWPESLAAAGALAYDSLLYRLLQRLECHLYRQAQAVVAVTPGWEDHFAAAGVSRERIHVVPNGADPDDFHVDAGRDELRKEFGLTRFTAIFAGAHGPKDGLDFILDAARETPDIDYVLIGSGTAKNAARQRAENESIDNVRFLDPISKRELPRLLRACDVGIHSVTPLKVFEKGMSPNKLFDYLAAGLPVVSNSATSLQGVLSDGECGPLGGPSDLAQLVTQVREASQEARRDWAERGQAIMRAAYSRQASADRLSAVLSAAITSAPRSRGDL